MPARKTTVLIVDDEASQRAWMRGILKLLGFAVLEAGCYQEALAVSLAHAGPIDLFLLDLRLPDGNGYDLSTELCSVSPGSKILLISGTAGAELCKYFETPVTAVQFLHKPFQAAELADRVKQLCQTAKETLIASAANGKSAACKAENLPPQEARCKRNRKC